MEEADQRTPVLLMPRDLIHRAVTDHDNHLIGYMREPSYRRGRLEGALSARRGRWPSGDRR
jgi:hypothetical protein